MSEEKQNDQQLNDEELDTVAGGTFQNLSLSALRQSVATTSTTALTSPTTTTTSSNTYVPPTSTRTPTTRTR